MLSSRGLGPGAHGVTGNGLEVLGGGVEGVGDVVASVRSLSIVAILGPGIKRTGCGGMRCAHHTAAGSGTTRR
jgi:hypothetical protein